jgi:hypothetical protein
MLGRIEQRQPSKGIASARLPAKVRAWMKQVESLPYYEKTTPPHWKG